MAHLSTPSRIQAAATTTSARRPSGAWRPLVTLAIAALLAPACTVEADTDRVETFRDDGCGAGLQLGVGSWACDYRGSPGPIDAPSPVTVAMALCDGSDTLICEFEHPCAWTVTSTGTCREFECPTMTPNPVRKSVPVDLPLGDTQCDPPDELRNLETCRAHADAQRDSLRMACSNKRTAEKRDQDSCCVEKPRKKKAPCDTHDDCDESSDDGSSESGDDTLDPSAGSDGGEPCPFGTEMICDAPAPEDDALACRCEAA